MALHPSCSWHFRNVFSKASWNQEQWDWYTPRENLAMEAEKPTAGWPSHGKLTIDAIDILSVVHVFSDSVQWRAELLEHAVAILWIHKCHEITTRKHPKTNQGSLTFLALLCFKFRKMTSLPLLAGSICVHERSPQKWFLCTASTCEHFCTACTHFKSSSVGFIVIRRQIFPAKQCMERKGMKQHVKSLKVTKVQMASHDS